MSAVHTNRRKGYRTHLRKEALRSIRNRIWKETSCKLRTKSGKIITTPARAIRCDTPIAAVVRQFEVFESNGDNARRTRNKLEAALIVRTVRYVNSRICLLSR